MTDNDVVGRVKLTKLLEYTNTGARLSPAISALSGNGRWLVAVSTLAFKDCRDVQIISRRVLSTQGPPGSGEVGLSFAGRQDAMYLISLCTVLFRTVPEDVRINTDYLAFRE